MVEELVVVVLRRVGWVVEEGVVVVGVVVLFMFGFMNEQCTAGRRVELCSFRCMNEESVDGIVR